MAERYEDILTLESNQWTYGCPVLIEGGVLQYDTVSERNLLTINFMNICDAVLSEVDLTIYASDEAEENILEIEHQYLKLHLEPGAKFGNNVHLPIEDKEAKKFKLKITKVVCEDDGSEWIKDDIFEAHPEITNPEEFGQKMDQEYEDKYNKCEELIVLEDSENLKKVVEILETLRWYKNCEEMYDYAKRKYDITLRTEKRKKREGERKDARKKKQKMAAAIAACIAGVAVIIFAIVYFTIIGPNHQVKVAKKYNNQGEFQKAIEICENLHGFGNSKEVLKEANYQIGFLAFNQQDFETALKYFEKTTGYKGTNNLLSKSYYNLGQQSAQAEQYEAALDYYTKGYNTATEDKVKLNCQTGIALAQYKLAYVTEAWSTINAVYEADKNVKAAYDEYGYAYAMKVLSEGNVDEATAVFKLIKGYADSAAQYGKIIYEKAVPVAEAGDLASALSTLKEVKDDYEPAGKLYKEMDEFIAASSNWVGNWKMKGDQGDYTMTISTLLYKGELCLKVTDTYLDYDNIISSKEKVRQIYVASERVEYKLKDVHNYKIILTRETSKKIKRVLSYDGASYIRKYKKTK